jgi:hypothetical protein
VRDVDSNQGNARFEVSGRDCRRHGLVDLELQCEIEILPHQVQGVLQRYLGLVPVVDDDELDLGFLRGAHEAHLHLAGERPARALGRVADPVPLAPMQLEGRSIPRHFDFFEEAAMAQRVEQPEAQALVEPCALDDIAETQHLARRVERAEHLRGVHHGFHEVRLSW